MKIQKKEKAVFLPISRQEREILALPGINAFIWCNVGQAATIGVGDSIAAPDMRRRVLAVRLYPSFEAAVRAEQCARIHPFLSADNLIERRRAEHPELTGKPVRVFVLQPKVGGKIDSSRRKRRGGNK